MSNEVAGKVCYHQRHNQNHAVGAPVFFIILSAVYFRKFNYTRPLTTAAFFIGFVIIIDFFVVALIINKSLDMFRSVPGTWLPFLLIFGAAWVTGEVVTRRNKGRER